MARQRVLHPPPFLNSPIPLTNETRMGASNVTGALLIDSQTGLCLGGLFIPSFLPCTSKEGGVNVLYGGVKARGKATEDDATYITVASRAALDVKGVGAVAYKDRYGVFSRGGGRRLIEGIGGDFSKVILRKGGSGVLVAVYKENDLLGESPDEM